MPDGRPVEKILLESGSARCEIITYGAAIVSLEVPDKNGNFIDVVLGFDNLEGYLENKANIGAICGRVANRIGNSRFSLNGKEYLLFDNIGGNHLHGGREGFDKRLWEPEKIPNGVRLYLQSPDMDEGYPGKLDCYVEYLLEGTTLTINYSAKTDRDTVINLTNHAYFNLDGHEKPSVLDHGLRLFAETYTPASERMVPTGEMAFVAGTPMDFREERLIGERIFAEFEQLHIGNGYDHNWIIDGEAGALRNAAVLSGAESGIKLFLQSSLPGLQIYTSNSLNEKPLGKGGEIYSGRRAVCLETQYFPDSPNRSEFPSVVLKPDEEWKHQAVFEFTVEQ